MSKVCINCGELKLLEEYYKNSRTSGDGRFNTCKRCYRKRQRQHYHADPAKTQRDNRKKNAKRKESKRIWAAKNPEMRARWRRNNPDKIKACAKRSREKERKDPIKRLAASMRAGLRYSLRRNKNGHHWEYLVGYTMSDLRVHLESMFKDGMSWDNYGEWHIDHIRPIASFTFKDYQDIEFLECWSLQNLQPLWASENHRKSYSFKTGEPKCSQS